MIPKPQILMIDDEPDKFQVWRQMLSRLDCEFLPQDTHHDALHHDSLIMQGAPTYQKRLQHQHELEQLRQNSTQREQLFRQALVDAPVPIMLHSEDGEVLMLSRVWCSLTGYTPAQLPTMRAWLLKAYGPERLAELQRRMDHLFTLDKWFAEGETDIHAADGKILTWDFHSGPLAALPDGRKLVISMAVDVTGNRLAAQALRNESQKNAMLLNAASDGIHILDSKGNVVQVNDAFCRLLGYPRETLQNSNATRWDVQYSQAELIERIRDLPQQGAIFETLYLHADGHLLDVEINAVRIDIDGQPMLYASARDVSERKQIQDTLRANAYLLSNAVRISHMGTWEWNILDDSEVWSDQQFRIFGLEPGSVAPSYDLFMQLLHPDDHPMVLHVTDQALNHGQQYDIECRIFWPSGEIRFIHCQGEVYRNDNDQPVTMIGTVLDVTDQHKREEAQRLAITVFNSVDEGVMVTDHENHIMAVNPAFTAITGYTIGDVVGQKPAILAAGVTPPTLFQEMWQALQEHGQWAGELCNQRKNGEIFIEWLSIKLVRDQQGKITHYVGVFSDITEKKKSEHLIWEQANFDALTKLANRHMLQDRLQQEIKKSRRSNGQLALLIIDLDRFKEVNDTLGHDMGDVLLVEASQRISACVRTSDTVARLGGDEFVIILSSLDELGCVERIARSLTSSLVQPFRLGEEEAYISASIGIAIFPNDANDLESLLKHADQAMYVSKNAGRNRFSYFAASMQETAQARRRLTNDLRVALEHQQFKVFYQPIIELSTGKIFKAEALIRWQHPTRGLVSPAQFIPLAEETGMIIDIGDWVFREAARQVKRWREIHHPDFQISVNKSPVQFRNDSGPHRTWFSYLKDLNLQGQGIVIEITEGLLMNVEKNVTDKLLAFRDAGIQVSLDDFGTGYSSLSYLKKFDIDYLKIDQSFVNNMDTDPDNLTLCESMILMAHKLGLQVIAEGVERVEQRDLLAKAGCDFAQGYLFSRPVAAEEFEVLLLANTMKG
jgi:diguanylate cyclase (GGDEF)-like protein/PAS domain S-box-containing protein